MTRPFLYWPLRRQLVLTLGGTVLLVGIVSGELGRDMATDSLQQNLTRQSQKTFAMLSAASIDAIISEDRPLLNTIVQQSVNHDPELVSLIIENEIGEPLATWNNEGVSNTTALLPFSQDILFDGESFGRMKIQWDLRKLHREADRQAWNIRVFATVVILILSVIIFLLVHSLVIRPINTIYRRLGDIANGNVSEQTKKLSAAEELVRLNSSVTTLRETLYLTRQRKVELEQAKEELSRARDEALAASQTKSEFLANMSHEIRTPINGVLGMLQLLQNTPLNAEQREFAQTSKDSGEILLNLINDILDFSKIEAGRLDLEQIDFDLRDATEGTVANLATLAHAKDLELNCLYPVHLPCFVIGDLVRLTQVLRNLVNNAIKFTKQGEVSVTVSHEEDREHDMLLRFEVRDTGIGIKDEAQSQLFNAFTQADGSTTRKYGGTGLGLAISKQLVKLMGGSLGVRSKPGEGSTFWFTASFCKAARSPDTCVSKAKLQDVRALIVDDNATNRRILEHFLKNWGIDCESAEDAFQAQQFIQENAQRGEPYHLGILDMQMPQMDGLELARWIKSDPTRESMSLVMLTSLGQSPAGWRDSGIETCLNKPARQSQLYNSIVTTLHGHSEQDGTSAGHALQQQPSSPNPTQYVYSSRILLVEDNVINQRVAQGLLQKMSDKLEVDVVNNGLEAVESCQQKPYELILMDVQMPVMDGFEATREIRELERDKPGSHLPIIAMTANAMKGDRENCILAGMDDYLSKPIKPEVLKDCLERWLSQRSEAAESQQTSNQTDDATGTMDMNSIPTADAIDENVIKELRELLEDEFDDLIATYLDDAFLLISAARKAIDAQDLKGLRTSAHSLKSASANVGAMQLSEYAEQLESMAREATIAEADLLFKQAEVEYQLVQASLGTLRPAKAS